MRLFIYGSCKKGFYNHERFGLQNATPQGDYVLPEYQLYSLGAYPAIVLAYGVNNAKVKGELYEVNQLSKDHLFMDQVERGAGYRLTRVYAPTGKKADDIYSYVFQEGLEGATLIPDGEWKKD